MQVVKRTGKKESVSFDKITARVKKLCYGLDSNFVDPTGIAMKVIQNLEKERKNCLLKLEDWKQHEMKQNFILHG